MTDDFLAALAADPRCVSTTIATGQWLHLTGIDINTDQSLVASLTQDEVFTRALTEWHPRPHYFERDHRFMAIIKAPNLNANDKIEDMVALRIYTDGRHLFSFSIAAITSVAEIQQLAQRESFGVGVLVVKLAQMITSKLRRAVAEIIEDLDILEDQGLDPNTAMNPSELLLLRRKIIGFKRTSAPQSVLFLDLAEESSWAEEPLIRESFEQLHNANARIDEILDALRQRAESVNQLVEADSRKTVERFSYLLTVAAGIFLPLNLIAGLFGANVGGLPLTNDNSGFNYLILMLLGAGVFSLLISVVMLRWIDKRI